MTANPECLEQEMELFFLYCSPNVALMTLAFFLVIRKVRVKSKRMILMLENITKCGLGIYMIHYFRQLYTKQHLNDMNMESLKNYIAKCVCKGIEMYVNKHRFAFKGMIEMLPMTHEEFEKHVYKVLTKDAAKSYLEDTTPTTQPQLPQ